MLGARGKVGTEVCRAVDAADDLELVATLDVDDALVSLVEAEAQAIVDFTHPDAVMGNLEFCVGHGIHAVVGTTGFDADRLATVEGWLADAPEVGVLVAPNFSIGAVLMMRFAELAARYFETTEIIELHHDQKADAPSGTAMLTAERVAAASAEWAPDPTKETLLEGARGGLTAAGIHVHSVRLRGLVAHQEVLFGTTGQSLSIRHDSYDRSCFMPGVLLAVKRVADHPGLTIGLDALIEI